MDEQLGLFGSPENKPTKDEPAVHKPGHDRTPSDESARQRVRESLDETLFVEAGAGSGKTSALVDRVVQLVLSGVEIRHIAAITFTEKAALELRDRIRREFEELAHSTQEPATAELCAVALDQLDSAAISTLHAFAQRILGEHAVEAGLPPSIEVLDEISSQVSFDQRWREFIDELLDDPNNADLVLLADVLNVKLDTHLRDVADAFLDNWDLVATRVGPAEDPGRPRIAGISSIVDSVEQMIDSCTDPEDKLLGSIEALTNWRRELDDTDDWLDLVALLRDPGVKGSSFGRAGSWPDVDAVRDLIKAALAEADSEISRLVDRTIRCLANIIKDFTLDHVEERRTSGRLEFHDLLVMARQMLRHPHHGTQVRAAVARRYTRLLLDEFQDTDPIQIELAVLIASDDPDAGSKPWSDISTPPGRLFFVGDPKQSIYRFRRADVALFLEARDSFAQVPLTLDTNFRTVEPVIDWVNGIFEQLIRPETGRQPRYQPLQAWRDANPATTQAVTVLGAAEHGELSAENLRRAEAEDVAAIARVALDEGWLVDDDTPRGEPPRWRPAQPSDITILLPARTSLHALERALDAEGLDYRAETSSLVWSTTEIRELMAVLRAIDDPTDELSIVTALRSAVYGCGDDDLYRWSKVHKGPWNHQHEPPHDVAADDPVAVAMAHLREMHQLRMWIAPSALVERIVRERRLLELGVARGRSRDVWRRLRFVQDQARAYVDSEGGGLRQFVAWATLQSAEGSRVAETLLPETDADAIRIMTIHGSKGLEFPITILSGLTTRGGRRRPGVQVAFPADGGSVIKMGKDLATADYDAFKPIDEQMDHLERLRLLYVGATRARDHLVVSLHRPAKTKTKAKSGEPPAQASLSAAQLLYGAAVVSGVSHREFSKPVAKAAPASITKPTTGPTKGPNATHSSRTRPVGGTQLNRADWARERNVALERSTTASTIGATTVAKRAQQLTQAPSTDPGLDKGPRDLDLPPWNKGRYGTAIGRAVHAVLQTVDLDTGSGLEVTVAAQAAAEGVIGREDIIADLTRAALYSAVVREAVQLPYWRETYVAAPIEDGVVVEGYIDLLYRRSDGLVVVDYKTDAIGSDAELVSRLDKYALQGASYALALERATGEQVAEVVFLFLARDGSRTVPVDNLSVSKARVIATLKASQST
ncbi:MAG: UvrD-helicase domain-containing protein [Actinobacteria bacterium]|nr:UvrD-helicase domain-containing protein [Actinomycetota bacterium]